ncbi:MAG: MacS family sensor histidine kinase [Dermatophilaceae bacterium]
MVSSRGEVGAGDSLVLNALWGAVRVFRWLALGYAAWGAWARREAMASPQGVALVLSLLLVWTVFMQVWNRRDLQIHVLELVLACTAVFATRWVDTPEAVDEGVTTVPGVWQSVPVVAIAVILGWQGGLLASLVVSLVMIATVGRLDTEPVSNAGLLILLGTCVGYAADVARKEQDQLSRALTREATLAERDRLARTVHDGVLQALAFINRRGLDLGGEAARLGTMAAEQEQRLRALVSGVPPDELGSSVGGPVDLCAALTATATGTATVVAPAGPVLLDRGLTHELAAAVEAALDNVRRHAGDGARAWVLVDDLGPEVLLTVRDDGVGVSQERMDEASARGRLGVASSIRARIEDLGGKARYVFGPGGGTTLEMWVPKQVMSPKKVV